MLLCRIKRWTKTSKGLAMPGPKLVQLPDDEARSLESRGDVEVIEAEPGLSSGSDSRSPMDRRMRKGKHLTRGAAVLLLLLASTAKAQEVDSKVVTLNGATSTLTVPFNSARRYLRISNPGTNAAACTTHATATATNGDPIPAGGSIDFDRQALALMARRCFSTSGTTLFYTEETRDVGLLSAPTPTPTPTPTPAPTPTPEPT